ncbi:low molecular weight protein arginine phosphatase [Nibricoccus sp. IMCC34717]|uniref:arsenate reductase/protein-tyrosine-phosphatase family protein n=1 Tax=Nibricoccus sp. IMCC34717 TaxID=3034021 RepID=UPI00384B240E
MGKSGYILTVCTANICRSPMAGALLQHALRGQAEPLRSLKVFSAGVAARAGERASAHSVTALKKVGIALESHASQPVTRDLLAGALAVFCMTESHRAMIQMQFDPPPRHLYLFREFLPPPADPEIGDPYGGSLDDYEACRDEMVEAVPGIIQFLRSIT